MLFCAFGRLPLVRPFDHLPVGRNGSCGCCPRPWADFDRHIVVAPRKHVSSTYDLSDAEQNALWVLVSELRSRLLTGLMPDAFSIGFNDTLHDSVSQSLPRSSRIFAKEHESARTRVWRILRRCLRDSRWSKSRLPDPNGR